MCRCWAWLGGEGGVGGGRVCVCAGDGEARGSGRSSKSLRAGPWKTKPAWLGGRLGS